MDLEQVYERYFKDVYYYIYGISKNEAIAEDITQETFFKALKKIKSFDGSTDIRAWLFTIAKNTYYTTIKREKIYSSAFELENIVGNHQRSVLDDLINDQQAMQILKYLHSMDEPYKEVFMLRFFGELSFEKVGIIFGKSAGWSRVIYHRAKNKIVDLMEEEENETI
ncbi:MAG: sigma-70 family RNA polymerase sigma factor [Erysipelotrichaceae bacterium]